MIEASFVQAGIRYSIHKQQTSQEQLKAQIDSCLAEKPLDMVAFLQAMEKEGYEVKQGRGGVISFCTAGQDRFTRLRASTLGEGYGQENIQAIIEGRAVPAREKEGTGRKVNLIIDIQSRMRAGKGPAYQQWAKIHNLKQMAATLQYLQENNLLEYSQLDKRSAEAADRFHALADQIKSAEDAKRVNAQLKAAIADYAKTRPVFEKYKAAKYSRKYHLEHEADLALYRAAQNTFRRLLDGAKLPKMDALKAESQTLAATKKVAYGEYRAARKEMQELITDKANVDVLLGLADT